MICGLFSGPQFFVTSIIGLAFYIVGSIGEFFNVEVANNIEIGASSG